jgi:putative membrane protein
MRGKDDPDRLTSQEKETDMIRLCALILLILGFLAPAFGQTTNPASPAPGNPGGMAPATKESSQGIPAPRQINQADRTFIHEAAIGGLAEVDLAKLAARKGSTSGVKEFAQRMIRDHGSANDRLATLAKADALRLPDTLDDEHKTLRARLEQSDGARFDQAYIQAQIIDHQKTALLLEHEIGSGENAELKNFASDILPVVLSHLRMAQAISAELHQAAEVPPGDHDRKQ